ncbi:MAG: sigma-70 family RNA polymerase sigma factor [Candidatus Korobacteraceae bacterium]
MCGPVLAPASTSRTPFRISSKGHVCSGFIAVGVAPPISIMKKAEQNDALWNVSKGDSEIVTPSSSSESVMRLCASPQVRGASAGSSEIEVEVVTLFDELRNRLLRYVLAFGICPSDGEEIIQEAFLSLFQHLQQQRSRQNLRGWLFRVAHNQALKRLAANARRRDLLDLDVSSAQIHPDPAPNPEEQVRFTQRQTRLGAVLEALPTHDQQCLRLRAEGLRYREIAEVLGISLGSVSASLARSLARLARADER